MNYTQTVIPNAIGIERCVEPAHFALSNTERRAEGSLTNYKEVVDINDDEYSFYDDLSPSHYGLSLADFAQVKEKLKFQKTFLTYSFLKDRLNQKYIPLSELIISANHAPERYYAEIQNRVNTLETIAKERNLKPLFMTLTLPSEYHKHKITKSGKLVKNLKYNGVNPRESVKLLTKMFAKLRQDRSLKELKKEERIYFRVNEPHKDGTPHTHILMFIPSDRIEKVKTAYKRLFDTKANDIQVVTNDIKNSVAYVMKYVNKVLPLSQKKNLSIKEEYLNAWYSKHRIVRFNASKTLAPLEMYRLLHKQFSMFALTKLINDKVLTIYTTIDSNKIMEIFDGEELLYERNHSYSLQKLGVNNCQNYSQTSDSAIGVSA
jgi:hypothetical protein